MARSIMAPCGQVPLIHSFIPITLLACESNNIHSHRPISSMNVGTTAYPDFLNPNTTAYWNDQITKFLSTVPIDGLWIDMNEVWNMSLLCNVHTSSNVLITNQY